MPTISPNTVAKTSFLIAFATLMTTQTFAHLPEALTDTDGDGVISAHEIREIRDTAKAQMLSQFDTDGDGELSRAERKAARQARHSAVTAAFDADGDGELSREERRAAKAARKEAIELQLDVNGDGEVSSAERAGLEEIKNQRRDHKDKRGQKEHSTADRDNTE